jgi:hypothetical protein
MKSKLFLLLLPMLLTFFTTAAFGAVPGKITCPQDLAKLQFLNQSKVVAKTVAATPASQGKVSGRATARQGGAGIANITVTAHPQAGDFCSISGGSALTDADGNYTIIELASGSYKIEFSDDQEKLYSGQWYSDKIDENLAAVIQVAEPATTSGINASLDKGGSISGKVTCPSGASSSTFSIQAVGNKGYTAYGSAMMMSIPGLPDIPGLPGLPGFDGSYTLSGLPSDTYTVSFSNILATDQARKPADRCVPQDRQVVVTAPSVTTNINMTLALGGSITGKLVDAAAVPIQNVPVYATAPNSSDSFFGAGNYGLSGTDGTFTISGLAAGTYDVIINGRQTGTGYILLKLPANTVTLSVPKDISTQTLHPGGMIKGTVTNKSGLPLDNVSVVGYDAATGEFISYTPTVANGIYTLTGFATGDYKVQFSACQGGYAEQWFDKMTSQATATLVAVTAPNDRPGINGFLDLAGSNSPPIATSQEVTTAAGTAKSITLAAIDTNGDNLTYSIVSQPLNGKLTGIPPAVTYTPSSGYSGSDSFTFKANDGKTDSNSATVSITITPPTTSKAGDCDGNGTVTIAEVQSGINMFLGLNPVKACVDTNGNNAVSIDEVQKVINSFLGL